MGVAVSADGVVAPYMGAWIEIPVYMPPLVYELGRSLHGGVD